VEETSVFVPQLEPRLFSLLSPYWFDISAEFPLLTLQLI
jgi:hypothetical protein